MTRFDNLPGMFFTQAQRYAERPRYRFKREDRWQEVSWEACAERVRAMAGGLLSLGLTPGDRVALLAATRPEWMELDLAILAAGGITVPIYPSNLHHECGYIIWNSESSVVCVENAKQLAKIRQVQADGFELDGQLRRIDPRQTIVIDEPGDDQSISLQQLMERGRRLTAADLQRRYAAVG